MAIRDPYTGSSSSTGGIRNPPGLAEELPAWMDIKQALKMQGVYFGPTPPASPLTWSSWHPLTNPGWFAWVPTP